VERDATVVSAVLAGLADESPSVLQAVMKMGRKARQRRRDELVMGSSLCLSVRCRTF